jgi:hypothetical protein
MKLRSEVIYNREKEDPAKETLKRLLAGICIIGLLEEIILLIVSENHMAATLGILLGLWVAAVNSVYIYHSLGKALELDEKSSAKAMRRPVLIRYCFMGIAIAISLLYPQIFSPIGTILGLLSMKLSAYVQPFFFEKNTNAGELQTGITEEEDDEEEQSQWGFGVFHQQPRE